MPVAPVYMPEPGETASEPAVAVPLEILGVMDFVGKCMMYRSHGAGDAWHSTVYQFKF